MFKRLSVWVIFKIWIRRKLKGDTQVSFENTIRAHRAFENKDANAFVQSLLPQTVRDRIAKGESAPKLPR